MQRVPSDPLVLRAVVYPTHILTPRHLASVLVEIANADAVMLAELGTAQAAEEALDLIGASAIV